MTFWMAKARFLANSSLACFPLGSFLDFLDLSFFLSLSSETFFFLAGGSPLRVVAAFSLALPADFFSPSDFFSPAGFF